MKNTHRRVCVYLQSIIHICTHVWHLLPSYYAVAPSSCSPESSALQLEEEVALPAAVLPAVALHYGGGGGHQAGGGHGGVAHAELGKLLWNTKKLLIFLFLEQFSDMRMSNTSMSPLNLMPSSSSIVECCCGQISCRQCNLLLQLEGWDETSSQYILCWDIRHKHGTIKD